MNAVAAETGDEVEFETMSFSGLIGALRVGPDRHRREPDHHHPGARGEVRLHPALRLRRRPGRGDARATRRDHRASRSCSGKTVAVNLGSNFEELLRELPYADEIDIRTYESNIEQDTALGRVDAFVMDRVSTAQVIAESPLPLALAGAPFSRDPERPAVPQRRGRPGAARPGRRRDHHAEGRTARSSAISQKWLGADVTVRPERWALDLDYMLGLVPVILALRAADPRHGDRGDGDRAGARLGARGDPGAEGAGRRRLRRALHQLLPRHAAPGAALPLLLRPAAGLQRAHRDRRRHRRDHGADAAFLRLHGREHPRRDHRRRPQPVGGRRTRSA